MPSHQERREPLPEGYQFSDAGRPRGAWSLPEGFRYLDINEGIGHASESCPGFDAALVTATTCAPERAVGFTPCPLCLTWSVIEGEQH